MTDQQYYCCWALKIKVNTVHTINTCSPQFGASSLCTPLQSYIFISHLSPSFNSLQHVITPILLNAADYVWFMCVWRADGWMERGREAVPLQAAAAAGRQAGRAGQQQTAAEKHPARRGHGQTRRRDRQQARQHRAVPSRHRVSTAQKQSGDGVFFYPMPF